LKKNKKRFDFNDKNNYNKSPRKEEKKKLLFLIRISTLTLIKNAIFNNSGKTTITAIIENKIVLVKRLLFYNETIIV